jgi:hypothetical protein
MAPGAAHIRGVVGLVKWAYYNAAAINGYKVSRGTDNVWKLRATVVSADSFKLAQRPLRFVAPHDKGEWEWPITEFNLSGGQLTATLGEPLQ